MVKDLTTVIIIFCVFVVCSAILSSCELGDDDCPDECVDVRGPEGEGLECHCDRSSGITVYLEDGGKVTVPACDEAAGVDGVEYGADEER